jgi:hypothetical protein
MHTTTPCADARGVTGADATRPADLTDLTDLTDLQDWFQNAILDPHGRSGEGPELTSAVLTGSARQTASERLAVYQRGYRLRLLGSLRTCFPALRHLLGPEAFDVLAREYIEAVPPSSYTLDHAMQGFPVRLAHGRPDAQRPDDERDPWVDLVVDLARFERAFAEVFSACEPAPQRQLACRHPVQTYAAAIAHGREPAPPEARPVLLTLRRRGHTVVVTETNPSTPAAPAIETEPQ